MSYSSSFIISTMIQRFAERLRNAIAEKINRVPSMILIVTNKEILVYVTNDVDLMTQPLTKAWFKWSLYRLIDRPIFMMFKTDWHLAVTGIVSIFAGLLFPALLVKSQPLFKQQQDNLAKVSGYVEEIYSGQCYFHNGRHQAKDHLMPSIKICIIACEIPFFSG